LVALPFWRIWGLRLTAQEEDAGRCFAQRAGPRQDGKEREERRVASPLTQCRGLIKTKIQSREQRAEGGLHSLRVKASMEEP